jgi:hypothetical protein
MKLTKLSLIAALAVTAAMAGDAKISGDMKVFYGTTDSGSNDLFNKGGAMGDAAVNLNYTNALSDMVTLNAGVTGISTLGLEHELVGATWVNHGGSRTAAGLDDKVWIDTANVVLKPIDKTMIVAGRQALDTPLAFTETWNIAKNTFDAAVLVDNHIEKTTLIGAWVGRGNGHNGYENVDGGMSRYGALSGHTVADGQQGGLNTSGIDIQNSGAFAAAAITKAIPLTTAQAWYYNVRNEADAVWLQGDIAATKELSVGLQYSKIMPKAAIDSKDDTEALAAKVGYEANGLSLAGAYSEISDKGLVYMGNTATGGAHNGQSKLYTDAWWNLGFVGQAGAKTAMVSAAYDAFTAQYTTVSNDNGSNLEMDEITLTASKKVGPFDATVALINTNSDLATIDGNTVQVYLTAPFSL